MSLIKPATTAAETYKFKVSRGLPIAIHCTGLDGVETIPLNINSGGVLEPVTNEAGDAIVLSITRQQLLINGAGNYELVKGITANPVSVFKEE